MSRARSSARIEAKRVRGAAPRGPREAGGRGWQAGGEPRWRGPRQKTPNYLRQASQNLWGSIYLYGVGSAENSHITDTCESRHEMRARALSCDSMWCCARCGGGGAPSTVPAAPTASVRLPLAAPVQSAIAGVGWAEVAREGGALATAHVEIILAQRWRCGTALARRRGPRRCGSTAAGGFGLDQLVVPRRTDEARRNLEQRSG